MMTPPTVTAMHTNDLGGCQGPGLTIFFAVGVLNQVSMLRHVLTMRGREPATQMMGSLQEAAQASEKPRAGSMEALSIHTYLSDCAYD